MKKREPHPNYPVIDMATPWNEEYDADMESG